MLAPFGREGRGRFLKLRGVRGKKREIEKREKLRFVSIISPGGDQESNHLFMPKKKKRRRVTKKEKCSEREG